MYQSAAERMADSVAQSEQPSPSLEQPGPAHTAVLFRSQERAPYIHAYIRTDVHVHTHADLSRVRGINPPQFEIILHGRLVVSV